MIRVLWKLRPNENIASFSAHRVTKKISHPGGRKRIFFAKICRKNRLNDVCYLSLIFLSVSSIGNYVIVIRDFTVEDQEREKFVFGLFFFFFLTCSEEKVAGTSLESLFESRDNLCSRFHFSLVYNYIIIVINLIGSLKNLFGKISNNDSQPFKIKIHQC